MPLVISGPKPSAEWVAATLADTGVAFTNGFLWGTGLVLLWGLIYLGVRSEFSTPPRTFAIGALVASLIGLTLSVITL